MVFCDCEDGWSGIQCSEDFNSCSNLPCYHGVTCLDLPPPNMAPSCSPCPPGQIGDGVMCYGEMLKSSVAILFLLIVDFVFDRFSVQEFKICFKILVDIYSNQEEMKVLNYC